MPAERTALYRYFDADDDLLYIGISIDPDGRLKAHRHGHAPWVGAAARRTIEWHDSRTLALKAEEVAVKTERPAYNGTHNYDDAVFDPSSWPAAEWGRKVAHMASLICDEINSRRWTKGQRLPSVRTMAKAADTSQYVVSKASALLQREGLLTFEPGRGLFVASETSREPALPELGPPAAPQRTLPRLPHDWPRSVGFPG